MKTNQYLLMAATAALSLVLGACTVGPKYHAPAPAAPPEFKGASAQPAAATPAAVPPSSADPTQAGLGAWNVADPKDGLLKGKWWEMYNEPELNALEEQLVLDNQSIKQSMENYTASRAMVRESRAALFPTAAVGASGTRSRTSANAPGATKASQATLLELPATVSWEPDLWGKVRNAVRQAQYNAQVSAADLENVRLTEQAALATYYFELRGQDAQTVILQQNLDADLKTLEYTRAQFETGIGTELAMVQAQSTVDTVRSSLINLGLARAQYEHAIATLIGKPAPGFSMAVRAQVITPPAIPVGVPSNLLERRPDIAAAERQLASANAQIGIAKAAFYPSITLSASGGLESSAWKHLLDWPSRFWSIGPSVSETVLDAGLRRATMQQYTAVYNGYLAGYRLTVLTAFQQVEDALSALRVLSDQIQQQHQAVLSAQRALDMEMARYQTGLDSYLNVVTEQNALLSAQQTLATLEMQRAVYSVQLIEALGGGWDRSLLPTPEQVKTRPATAETIQP